MNIFLSLSSLLKNSPNPKKKHRWNEVYTVKIWSNYVFALFKIMKSRFLELTSTKVLTNAREKFPLQMLCVSAPGKYRSRKMIIFGLCNLLLPSEVWSSINTAHIGQSISVKLFLWTSATRKIKMKIFVFLFALIVGLFGLTSATICARDGRSGNGQNFADRGAMYAENGRGGRKLSKNLYW